ncbi:MAG: NTP transferase domain-containing protein [Rhodospirillaceae bacterium]|nr:NTP transferase domain-containing protein [Rhodospirillaceae bacterium]
MAGFLRFPSDPDLPVAAVLAGGDGVRLNRGAKPMVLLSGLPLIAHTINALTPQVRGLMLGLREKASWVDQFSAEHFDLPIITDAQKNAGPAAGVASVLSAVRATEPFVMTAPADCPFLPPDLSTRLRTALAPDVEIAVAMSGGQRHHLVALWRTEIAEDVERAVADGPQAIHKLQSRFRVADVTWPTAPYDPFFNINTPDDLTQAEAICSTRRGEKNA